MCIDVYSYDEYVLAIKDNSMNLGNDSTSPPSLCPKNEKPHGITIQRRMAAIPGIITLYIVSVIYYIQYVCGDRGMSGVEGG